MRLVRAYLASSQLILGGVLAHHLAGSAVASTQSLASLILFSCALSLLLSNEEITEGRLFFAVFVAQNGSHFLLGGSTHNTVSMYAAHTVAGVISYQTIAKSAVLLQSLSDCSKFLASKFFPKLISTAELEIDLPSWTFTHYLPAFREQAHFSALTLRAPPAL
jgi:hypothetical protein